MAISPKLWQITTVWRYDQSQLLCLSCIRGPGSSLDHREDDADQAMGIQRCGPTSLTVGGQDATKQRNDRQMCCRRASWLPLNSSGGRALMFGVSCCCAPAPASRTRLFRGLPRKRDADEKPRFRSRRKAMVCRGGGVLRLLIGSRCMMAH